MCGDTKNLHFDHELPFSKGGTSLSAKNVRLLCMKHNLQKSDKIE
jgi:5-methylcytosine-specific restriction endonuclease McrA